MYVYLSITKKDYFIKHIIIIMSDLIFYKDIKFDSNLKNDAVRLGNEVLKRTRKYISKMIIFVWI